MTAFVQIFGGQTILPAQPSYRAFDLDADTILTWPIEVAVDGDVVAQTMDVTPGSAGLTLLMPPADQVSPGQGTIINNRGSDTFTVADNDGNTITTIAPTQGWLVYVADNATTAGQWFSLNYGAGVANANAGALAGSGLKAIGATLAQSIPITEINNDYVSTDANRAIMLLWTGGAGTITLPSAVAVGNDWFFQVRNEGTGALVIDPVGAEMIDGTSSITLNPGGSGYVTTDGANFYSLGLGQPAQFAFSYISIDLTGEPSPYVLSGAELNQIGYSFGGVLGTNMSIEVPATTQLYFVNNATSGAFTLTVKISGSTGTEVAQGASVILYSNGTDVVSAQTGDISLPVSIAQGGTGATTASNARINLGGTATGVAVFTAADAAAGRSALMAAALAGPQTLTGTRVTPRVSSTASIVSPLAFDSDDYDGYAATAQAGNFTISADAGTPTDQQKALWRVTCTAGARTITFTGGVAGGFLPVGATLGTSGANFTYVATASKTVVIGGIYNASSSRWEIVAISQET